MKKELQKDLARITIYTFGFCICFALLEPIIPNVIKQLYVAMFEYMGMLLVVLSAPLSYAAYHAMTPVEPAKK